MLTTDRLFHEGAAKEKYYSGEAGIGFTNNSHRQKVGGFHFRYIARRDVRSLLCL